MRFHFYSKSDEHGEYGYDGSKVVSDHNDREEVRLAVIAMDCIYGPVLLVSADETGRHIALPLYRRHGEDYTDAGCIVEHS